MGAPLQSLPDMERLSPRVIRLLGGNPGKFTLQGTNTYIVGTGSERILIDTGEGKESWNTRLAEVLRDEHASISHILLTHWHEDHVGGVLDAQSISPGVSVYKAHPSVEGQLSISDGQVFAVEGAKLTALFTPGHTVDHMVFVLDEEGDSIFAGDNVLGHGTAVFEDLDTYLASLERMKQICRGRIYPAHGPVVERGKEKIQEYIEHRRLREQQVIKVLEVADGTKSVKEIVKVIYEGYHEDLHEPAERGITQILTKLRKGGRVIQRHDGWQISSGWSSDSY